jgi:uncharacterized membrane protein
MSNLDSMGTEQREQSHLVHRICWSAVIAGAFVGLGLAFLLHLYGAAISLSAYSSTSDGATAIAIGGMLGMLIGVIVSMAIAGFVSGYLGRFHYYPLHGGVIYGFITWSLILFLSAVIAVPMSNYISAFERTLYHSSVMQETTSSYDSPNLTKGVSSSDGQQINASNDKSVAVKPTHLAWGGWVIFALFFIGALSSCIGASYGIRCTRDSKLN